MSDLIVNTPKGLYCPPGDFHIDPWRPVDRAVVTHAHADHARSGSNHYLAATPGGRVLQARLGPISLQTLSYGESIRVGEVNVSLHPAGHVLGSAQVRIEHRGCVWVASGDYKLDADPTCTAFEPVRCHTFITESTFGLPIYRWDEAAQLAGDINAWWQENARQGRASVIYGYAFGKAQRILHGLDPTVGPIVVHGAVARLNEAYRASGVTLPHTSLVSDLPARTAFNQALVVAPPSAQGTPWLRRFGQHSDAFASGWMRVRGARRRRGVDRGFVMSDHADWPGLLEAIAATGAHRVIVTHGQVAVLMRWLAEQGLQADRFRTEYDDTGEDNTASDAADDPVPSQEEGTT